MPKRWLTYIFSIARRIARRLSGRPAGQWVTGSHTEARRFLQALLPHSNRSYRLYLPGSYNATRSWPMLVMLHGCKQDPEAFAIGTRMNEIADQEGFIVLYPEQKRVANIYRCWNWFNSTAQRGDGEAALIAGIVREASATYAVDPARVYIAGLSAGGAMTSIMVACYGNLFAACAVHSGLMYRAAESLSEATRAMKDGSHASPVATARQAVAQKAFAAVPAIVIHGSADDTVNPVNADQVTEQFLDLYTAAGGDNTPLMEFTSSKRGGERYPYEVREFRRGAAVQLRKVLVYGLGHAWSGGDAAQPFNDPHGPDASRMIWEFFSEFERSELKPATALAG